MYKLMIDFVLDIVCFWCVIGYFRLCYVFVWLLEVNVIFRWYFYELNLRLVIGGENLCEYLNKKYGISFEVS